MRLVAGVRVIPRHRIKISRIILRRPGAASIFPLRFRRQPVNVSALHSIQSSDKFLGIIPAHVFNWTLIAVLKVRWVRPYHRTVLRLRYLIFPHIETLYRHAMLWMLLIVSYSIRRTR